MPSTLEQIPGLGGYLAKKRMNEEAGVAELQRAGLLQDILAKTRQNQMMQNITPEQMKDPAILRQLGMKDPRFMAEADRLEKLSADQALLGQMRGERQLVQPSNEGTPAVQAAPTYSGGIFDDLTKSKDPSIAREATRLKAQIESAGPGTPTTYFLSRQKQLYDANRALEAKQSELATPMSDIGRLNADLKAGRITQAQHDQAVSNKIPEKTSDASIRDLAIQSMYDSNAIAGYRRDKDAMRRIGEARVKVMWEEGITSEDVVSGRAGFKADTASLNKLTPMYDAVVSFEKTAVRNGEVLKQLADKVDATGVPAIERWVRAGRQATGDPDVAAFNAQLMVYRTEAAKILTNPNLAGQLTDEARREVEAFMRPGASGPQIKRVVDLLANDFERRKGTLEEQISAIRGRMRSRLAPGGGATPPPGGAPAAPTGNPVDALLEKYK